MDVTSKTGLLASPTKTVHKLNKPKPIQLKAVAKPAPYVLKPFAGLYNPYPYGCSLLCNHPADVEARELLRKARDTWAIEGKNLLLAEEVAAIRANLQHIRIENHARFQEESETPEVGSVPEELFRRYTQTDSRPLTPAPTLASIYTRASGSRRCVTPDPTPTTEVREKTMLILDLRRSHSQETLSWYGGSLTQEPPLIKIQQVPTRTSSPLTSVSCHIFETRRSRTARRSTPSSPRRPKSYEKTGLKSANQGDTEDTRQTNEEDEDEDFIKRRGKRRKKRGRDLSGGVSAFQTTADPETQVATIGPESHNPSARPSLVPPSSEDTLQGLKDKNMSAVNNTSASLDFKSYLDSEMLRQLRRELNEEVVDNEFNYKRRKALEEALKTIPPNKTDCDELVKLRKELNLPPVNADLWLNLPRIFSRSSARFELPMDSRLLSTITPIDYVRDNVSITSPRKLLYGCIFNKIKTDLYEENEEKLKHLPGKALPTALNFIMGKDLTKEQLMRFNQLMGWKDDDQIDFKTFCGICALCERILAPEFCKQLPDKKSDPCHEIETADFESLTRRLHGQKPDPRIVEILYAIKDF